MNKFIAIAAIMAAFTSQPALAATERMPCKSTEAVIRPSNTFLWVACPTEGGLVSENTEVHFKGDKRDFVVRSLKLIPLDGPLGGASGPDPRVAELTAKLARVKAQLQTILAGL